MVKVFIDASGWSAILDRNNNTHLIAREYFQQLLDKNARIYSNILEINLAIEIIKKNCGLTMATDFSKLVEEAIISAKMHISWHSRRLRRAALRQYFTIKDQEIEIKHCYIFEEVRKKKINFIFSFDHALTKFGIPLMPQG